MFFITIPNSSLQNETMAPHLTLMAGIWIISSVEFIVDILTIPLALLNFSVISYTSVVHPNLKVVLLVQSLSIAVYSMVRFETQIEKFALANVLNNGPLVIERGTVFIGQFLNTLGHVLLFERILSTVFVKTYETQTKCRFTICWLIITCSVAAIVGYFQLFPTEEMVANKLTLTVNYFILCLSVLEIVLAENIRAIRQLHLTFSMHAVVILFVSIFETCLYFWSTADNYAFIYLVYTTSLSIIALANFTILISIVRFHPVLKKRALKFVRWLFYFRHVQIAPQPAANDNAKPFNKANMKIFTPPENVLGGPLLNHSEPETHFQQLQSMWN